MAVGDRHVYQVNTRANHANAVSIPAGRQEVAYIWHGGGTQTILELHHPDWPSSQAGLNIITGRGQPVWLPIDSTYKLGASGGSGDGLLFTVEVPADTYELVRLSTGDSDYSPPATKEIHSFYTGKIVGVTTSVTLSRISYSEDTGNAIDPSVYYNITSRALPRRPYLPLRSSDSIRAPGTSGRTVMALR